jgi:DNA-binding MarR family transcriptional regulator
MAKKFKLSASVNKSSEEGAEVVFEESPVSADNQQAIKYESLEQAILQALENDDLTVSELAERLGVEAIEVKQVLDLLHARNQVIREWRGTGYKYLLMPF